MPHGTTNIKFRTPEPHDSVAGEEWGKGKREREGKTARGEEGAGERPFGKP